MKLLNPQSLKNLLAYSVHGKKQRYKQGESDENQLGIVKRSFSHRGRNESNEEEKVVH